MFEWIFVLIYLFPTFITVVCAVLFICAAIELSWSDPNTRTRR